VIKEEPGLRIDRQVAIAGRVTQADRGPLAGAVVRLTKMPTEWLQRVQAASALSVNNPGCATTRPNGVFYFLDLPDGEFAVAAGSGPEVQATVTRDAGGRIQMVWVDLNFSPPAKAGR